MVEVVVDICVVAVDANDKLDETEIVTNEVEDEDDLDVLDAIIVILIRDEVVETDVLMI